MLVAQQGLAIGGFIGNAPQRHLALERGRCRGLCLQLRLGGFLDGLGLRRHLGFNRRLLNRASSQYERGQYGRASPSNIGTHSKHLGYSICELQPIISSRPT
ncbi:hypothetical protein SDC9_70505 [bioreactor metagenome]|uniref:Uncharacterized protein n=1 Tax=bioreactor metagenome TaxID=1076179 RepID=A0A644Y7V3_9ZZZZ